MIKEVIIFYLPKRGITKTEKFLSKKADDSSTLLGILGLRYFIKDMNGKTVSAYRFWRRQGIDIKNHRVKETGIKIMLLAPMICHAGVILSLPSSISIPITWLLLVAKGRYSWWWDEGPQEREADHH